MSVEWKVPSLEVATQNYPTLGAREKNERRIHEWHKLSPTQFCMDSHLPCQNQDAANHRKSWACGVGLVPPAQMAFLHQPETISGTHSTITLAWPSTSSFPW